MDVDWNWTLIAHAEAQLLAVALPPLSLAVLSWVWRQVALRLRDARARGYVGQLVGWAQQAIPEKSQRYVEVSALLSRRYPWLKATDVEVLIESEVHALKSVHPALGAAPVVTAPVTVDPVPAVIADGVPSGSVDVSAAAPLAPVSVAVVSGGQG